MRLEIAQLQRFAKQMDQPELFILTLVAMNANSTNVADALVRAPLQSLQYVTWRSDKCCKYHSSLPPQCQKQDYNTINPTTNVIITYIVLKANVLLLKVSLVGPKYATRRERKHWDLLK